MNTNQITKHNIIRLRESKSDFAYCKTNYHYDAEVKIYKISAKKAKKKVAAIFENAIDGSKCKEIARQLLSNRNIWNMPIYETYDMSYVKNGVHLSTANHYISYIVCNGSEKDWVIEEDGGLIYTGGTDNYNYAKNINDINHKFSFVIMGLTIGS